MKQRIAHRSVPWVDAWEEDPKEKLFLGPMARPINAASPASHPLLGPDWSQDMDHSDEFTGPTLDPKWEMQYPSMNTQPYHLSYNRWLGDTNPNLLHHQFSLQDGNTVLRLATQQLNPEDKYLGKVFEYYDGNRILDDGRPNLRFFHYTSEMIRSNLPVGPYGFFEIRCRIPKSRHVIADFWLWNAGTDNKTGKPYYNEIDVFEIDGTDWHLTTHTRPPVEGAPFDHRSKLIRSVDNSDFAQEFNTYALKWGPNKVIFYLNNKVVRVVTEQFTDHLMSIADHAMYIIVNVELDDGDGQTDRRGVFADPTFPCYYDIDYIRVYKRNDHFRPDPVFSINGSTSGDYRYPVQAILGRPLLLNAIESYSPDGKYFVAVQEVDGSGNVLVGGQEASEWLSKAEIATLQAFDLQAFFAAKGLNLASTLYKVKLAAAGTTPHPWIEQNQYVYLSPCAVSMDFTINGKGETAIQVDYDPDRDFPWLILDAPASTPCDGDYVLAVEPSDANGNAIGAMVSDEVTSDEAQQVQGWTSLITHPDEMTQGYAIEAETVDHLDLNTWADAHGFKFNYGDYYRVTLLAFGSLGAQVENMKLLHIGQVTNTVDFSVNGDTGGTSRTVKVEFNPAHPYQPPLFLEGYRAKTSYRVPKPFMVSVETSDASWGRAGDEKIGWYSIQDVRRFDLRAFAAQLGLTTLDYGKYYRVTLATDKPWMAETMLVYIKPCTNAPDFSIITGDPTTPTGERAFHTSDFTPIEISLLDSDFHPNVRLSAWVTGSVDHVIRSSVSRYPNRYHFLSVQQCDSFGAVSGLEVMEWLDDDRTIKMGRPGVPHLGNFDLAAWAKDAGLVLEHDHYYRIKLCTGAPWQCHESIVYIPAAIW